MVALSKIESATIKLERFFPASKIQKSRTDNFTVFKLESLLPSGSFKIRAALTHMIESDPTLVSKGVCAASGGNHALAVATAAKLFGVRAVVVMPKEIASPLRIELCKSLGADVLLPSGRSETFRVASDTATREQLLLIPPFNSELTMLGTGTISLELARQFPSVEEVYCAVGGGGLISGVAAAIKTYNPRVKVFGVEPASANLLKRSLDAGQVIEDESVHSVAESLTPPVVGDLCLQYAQKYVDDVIEVSDQEILSAMRFMYHQEKIFSEPAGACAFAGALKANSSRKRAIVVSGANIAREKFDELLL